MVYKFLHLNNSVISYDDWSVIFFHLCTLWRFLIVTGDLCESYLARYQVNLPLTDVNKVDAHGTGQSVLNLPEERTFRNLGGDSVQCSHICPVLSQNKYSFMRLKVFWDRLFQISIDLYGKGVDGKCWKSRRKRKKTNEWWSSTYKPNEKSV